MFKRIRKIDNVRTMELAELEEYDPVYSEAFCADFCDDAADENNHFPTIRDTRFNGIWCHPYETGTARGHQYLAYHMILKDGDKRILVVFDDDFPQVDFNSFQS